MADQDSFSKAIPIRVVSVDSNGVPLPSGGSAVTIADNGNAVEGALADAAITTNAAGSLSGKLRGIVALLAGGIAVSWAAAQHVITDATSVTNATLSAETTKVIGTVNVAAGQAIQANAGTNLNTSALALDATLTGRTQKSQITDGTRDGTVKAASTLPLLTDTATVVTQRDPLPAGTNVIGHTITDATSVTAATLSAETTKVIGTARIIGNAGAVFDAATAAAVPANALLAGGTDGTNLRGLQTTSAANLTAATTLGAQMVAGPLATWSITHRPAAATKATATKGAGAAGVRHVVTGFSFILATVGTAQAAVVNLDVIDGASGGTTRLWSGAFGGIPVNSQVNIVITGCMLIGTAATAMTIEFSAAGAAASFEFVNLQGFSVS